MRTMITMVKVVQIIVSDIAPPFISHLQCFETLRNCCIFYTFWVLRSFYSHDAHHRNYRERCSNNHFRRWANIVYHIYRAFKIIKITVCFAHFGFYEISTPVTRTMLTMVNVVQIITSDFAHTVYIRFKPLSYFSKLQFVFHILALRNLYCGDDHHANYGLPSSNHHFRHCAHYLYHIYSVLKLFEIAVCFAHFRFTKFLLRWWAACWLWWTLFKTSFKIFRKLFKSLWQCFATFRNCCLFSTFWFVRSFYSDDAHHGNYGEHCSNHHFRRWAHIVYHIYSVLKIIEITVCFAHFGFTKFLPRWCAPCQLWWTLFKTSFKIFRKLFKSLLKCFETFRNCSLFCTFWLSRSFYSHDAHHGNYGERCSNHHFRRWAHIVYHIYSVLKIIEITVCFAHFGFYEISTPVMRTMLTMVNVVQIIISDIAPLFYITFTVFWNFSKLLFVLKHFGFYEVSTPMMRTMVTMANVIQIIISDIAHTVHITFIVLWNFQNCCLFSTLWLLRTSYSCDTHHANYDERCSNHHFWHCAHCVYHLYSVLKLFKIAVWFAPFGF